MVTTFGPTLMGLRREAGFADPGNITVVKNGWQTQGIESIGATWAITPTTSTGFSLTLQLCFTPVELGSLNEADLRFWRYSGGAWMPVGGAPTLSTSNGIRSATLTGVTALSAWTLATASPTAVTLRGLSAHSDALHPVTSPASALVIALLVVSLIGLFWTRRPGRG